MKFTELKIMAMSKKSLNIDVESLSWFRGIEDGSGYRADLYLDSENKKDVVSLTCPGIATKNFEIDKETAQKYFD